MSSSGKSYVISSYGASPCDQTMWGWLECKYTSYTHLYGSWDCLPKSKAYFSVTSSWGKTTFTSFCKRSSITSNVSHLSLFHFPIKTFLVKVLFPPFFLGVLSFPLQRTFFSLNSVGCVFERKQCFQTVHSPVDVWSGKVNTVGLDSPFVGSKQKVLWKWKRLKGAVWELVAHRYTFFFPEFTWIYLHFKYSFLCVLKRSLLHQNTSCGQLQECRPQMLTNLFVGNAYCKITWRCRMPGAETPQHVSKHQLGSTGSSATKGRLSQIYGQT